MSHVLVIGAGLSGCTTATRLAQSGTKVTLVERESAVGGRVRTYGCKATDKCNNCGVCLAGGLWEKVEKNPLIDVILSSVVVDISGTAGDFSATIKTPEGKRYVNGISSIVISTGFESLNTGISSHLQIEGTKGLMTGSEMEQAIMERNQSAVFSAPPKSVAFIQCFGSRDEKEEAMYCSRVCCAYSTRAAKVIKQYYPDCEIVFFYMELQSVANEDYFAGLKDLGIEFIKCRPLKISGGEPATIAYDHPAQGITQRSFDLVVLSDGIHPGKDSDWMAETYGLGQNKHGFLQVVGDSSQTGIYVSGCAKSPLKIEETYSDSVAVANAILASAPKCGGLDI